MDRDQIIKSLKNLEEQENMTAEEIREKIRLAISLLLKNNDADTGRLWKNVPCQGAVPDIEELTDYLILKLGENGGQRDSGNQA